MTLRKRLARLEAFRGKPDAPVTVTRIIFAVVTRPDGHTVAEAECAMVQRSDGWQTITRAAGESEAGFRDRIEGLGHD